MFHLWCSEPFYIYFQIHRYLYDFLYPLSGVRSQVLRCLSKFSQYSVDFWIPQRFEIKTTATIFLILMINTRQKLVRVVITADCFGHLQSKETRLVNPRTMVMSTIKSQFSILISGRNGGKPNLQLRISIFHLCVVNKCEQIRFCTLSVVDR